jgi:phage gp46-like protein
MDITLGNQNQLTKCFNFVRDSSGDVQFDDTEAHGVVTSAMEHLGSYWADYTHGGELYKLKFATSRAPSQAEAYVVASLDPMVQDGSILTPTVSASLIKTNGINTLLADTRWTTPNNANQSQNLEI